MDKSIFPQDLIDTLNYIAIGSTVSPETDRVLTAKALLLIGEELAALKRALVQRQSPPEGGKQ